MHELAQWLASREYLMILNVAPPGLDTASTDY